MDIVLAIVAAFLFALGLVLQEKSASTLPSEAVGAGFLARLAHQPVWLLGLAAQGAGFGAQAWALGIGRIGGILGPWLFGILLGWNLTPSRVLYSASVPMLLAAGAVMLMGKFYRAGTKQRFAHTRKGVFPSS